MEYRWNPEVWTEAVALPAAVVDRHIRLAGPTQLKVLLWLARRGQGTFDAAACAAAIWLRGGCLRRKRCPMPSLPAATISPSAS